MFIQLEVWNNLKVYNTERKIKVYLWLYMGENTILIYAKELLFLSTCLNSGNHSNELMPIWIKLLLFGSQNVQTPLSSSHAK